MGAMGLGGKKSLSSEKIPSPPKARSFGGRFFGNLSPSRGIEKSDSAEEGGVFGAEAVLADACEALVGEGFDALEGVVVGVRLAAVLPPGAQREGAGGENPLVGGLSLAGDVEDLLEEGFDLVLVHGGLGVGR
jgi:hypothetical protein